MHIRRRDLLTTGGMAAAGAILGVTAFKPIYNVRWPPWITELDPPERDRQIARGLAKRGYPTGTIEKILGGNWARVFGDALGDT